jgi:hypothetical protein
MTKTKVLASLLLVLAVLFMQVGSVAAAPQAQDTTPITGTIQSITTQTDTNGTTTVVVTLLDSQRATQTVRVSVETAVALGLVTLDPTTQQPVVNQTKVGQTVNIDPTATLPEGDHPIATMLGDFFHEDPAVINGYHEDGFGFGVIAQALWMSQTIGGDASLAGDILEAKRTGDFSKFTQPDGSPITNWGQLKKALRQSKDKHNLGVVVSGHANNDKNSSNEHGNGKDKDKDKGNGKDKNKNKP